MANPLGFDLGQTMATAETIRSARDDRATREAARQRGQAVNALRGRVAAGEEGAMSELVALAPDEAKQTLDAYNAMDERQKAQAQENIDAIGRMAAYVMQAQDPAAAYQTVRSNLDPEIAQSLPEQYDGNFVQMQLARAREIDDLLANPEKVTIGAEDRLYRDGQVIETAVSDAERNRQNSRGNALIHAQASGAGGGTIKSADTNAIYRQAAGLFGGAFDPTTGRISGLDADAMGKIQSITEEASRLYAEGESGTHAGAVAQAARRLGIAVQNLGVRGSQQTGGEQAPVDRNQLLQMYSE